uniref:Glycosyltransferase 2-like domain-containing protein n=1 Tax=Panagrolaimus superbus TaxID=310955 RepID=A0A914YBZ4_9BILA
MPDEEVEVSIIIPVKNGEKFLSFCLDSVLAQVQVAVLSLEISIYDDGSIDETSKIISYYQIKAKENGIKFTASYGAISGGVGYAKDKAVVQSSGRYLCFLDADDIMSSNRIAKQYKKAQEIERNGNLAFIGSCFERLPKNATERYTRWACNLTEEQLYTQIYTAFGPTLIAPTWFISRSIYNQVSGFNKSIKNGFPEDLDFFYKALSLPIKLCRLEESLVIYRYHSECATFGVNEKTIWDIRIKQIEKDILSKWSKITIWNAGKQGKKLYK